MNKRVKKMWIKALRSDEFKQGRDQLKNGRGKSATYCCLGVLCEVAKREGVIRSYRGSSGFLPFKVMWWAGLTQMDPVMGRTSAVKLNDTLRKTLSQIADRIEKHL